MDMQGALRARILAVPEVGGLVGGRVDWVSRPQLAGGGLPAITLSIVSDTRTNLLRGYDLRESRVQMDVWADTYAIKTTLVEAVIAAIINEVVVNGVRFYRATVDNSRDLGEQAGVRFIHRTAVDLIVRWTEE